MLLVAEVYRVECIRLIRKKEKKRNRSYVWTGNKIANLPGYDMG